MQKTPIIDEIQGIKVPDPYRWLEEGESADVQAWINSQNKKVDEILKRDPFQTFSDELVKNFKSVNFSSPIPCRGRYFYTERQPDEDQFVLYVKHGLEGNPIVLYNPNREREGNTTSIDYWVKSSTGAYVIYGISKGGDEMATLYIKNVDSNTELPENIIHCRYSSVQWLPDDSAFFYTRNARPGTVPKNEEHLHRKVYLHKLGDNPENDELIFGAGRPKDDMINIRISPDGRYLGIQVSQTWTENEVYIYDRETKETRPLITGIPSTFSIRFLHNKVLLDTNYQANNNRVLWKTYNDLYKPLGEWEELISEREFPITSIHITKSKILVEYLVNVCSEVVIFDYEGKKLGEIPMSQYSSLADISARRDEEEFFYGIASFTFPKIEYRYDPVTAGYSEYRKTDNPINPDGYEVKQEWYTSKDGTKVPLFIFHKKNLPLDGANPTILYGYGGFNSTLTPAFVKDRIPWIERGGVFVLANIRGGGEFGEIWHKSGMKEGKQNSFDDFIAAAEYLIAHNYTKKEQLGILGASNGGLLVSAVGVQRPNLFQAVCARVPLTDMVRFPQFGIAMRWIHEYGDPTVKEDLENILTWSPYHNVKEGTEYPNFFFTTANKDTRVDPLHARKMAARLQEVNTQNEVLVFTEMEAGHGAGKPVAKIVELQALILSFFATTLGLIK